MEQDPTSPTEAAILSALRQKHFRGIVRCTTWDKTDIRQTPPAPPFTAPSTALLPTWGVGIVTALNKQSLAIVWKQL